jgi:hypothetical protein
LMLLGREISRTKHSKSKIRFFIVSLVSHLKG